MIELILGPRKTSYERKREMRVYTDLELNSWILIKLPIICGVYKVGWGCLSAPMYQDFNKWSTKNNVMHLSSHTNTTIMEEEEGGLPSTPYVTYNLYDFQNNLIPISFSSLPYSIQSPNRYDSNLYNVHWTGVISI